MNIAALPLGKRPARHDPRTLCMAKYVGALPPAPASADWTPKLPWSHLVPRLNNSLGDCTCAGMANAVQLATANASTEISLPDADVLTAYEQACGYVNGVPSTDQGGDELTVLNYWKNTGIGATPHKISAFVHVNLLNQAEVIQALALFGFLYTGVALPVSAQKQVGWLWDVDTTPAGAPGSWGGHCVVIGQADATGLTCITWGAYQKMTWAFWQRYFDECFACITPDWIEQDGQTPSGFDLPTLQADLAQIT